MNKLLLLFCLTFLVSCFDSKSKVIHPTSELLEKISGADNTISLKGEPQGTLSKNEEVSVIKIIGDEEEVDSNYFLPEIGDVSVGKDLIFIAIPQLNEIRAFDFSGEFRFKTGGQGMGPGEFELLQSIDYDEETKKLVAVDAQEIELFEIQNDSALAVNSISIPSASFMTDACILNGALFGNGIIVEVLDSVESGAGKFGHLKGSLPIHKYDLETGEELFDFGEKYSSASGFVGFDGILSETNLHCNEASNTVVGIFAHYPLIVGYDPEAGGQKWNAGIIDFISPQREENLKGDETLHMPKKYYDRIEPMAELNSEFILLQTEFRPPNPEKFTLSVLADINLKSIERKNLLLNTLNGEIELLSNNQDRIIYQDDQITISIPFTGDPDATEKLSILEKQFSFKTASLNYVN